MFDSDGDGTKWRSRFRCTTGQFISAVTILAKGGTITTANITDTILRILGTVGLMAVVPIVCRSRTTLRLTSLTAAWWWLSACLLLWSIVWTTTMLTERVSEGLADMLWYLTAVISVCPAVAVLGARRPTARVWTGFVLVPLMLVLALPLVVLWDGVPKSVEIELPAVAGYLLVMLMGFGNYIGTRNTAAAVLGMGALGLLVIPLSTAAVRSETVVEYGRLAATMLIAVASAHVAYRSRSRLHWRTSRQWHPAPPSRRQGACSAFAESLESLNRLWIDFRDTFGIVWAQRICERVNATAAGEQWPVRLGRDGFVPVDGAPVDGVSVDGKNEMATDPAAREHIEQTLRWLLRRFVDPEWIDRRLSDDDFHKKT